MAVLTVLSRERVSVAGESEGRVTCKREAITRMAALLAAGHDEAARTVIERALTERERLQSTGVGGGVAVPHGSVDTLDTQVGALLVCPDPIDFDSIDGAPVGILFGLVGPKGAPAQHLKILARVSRLFRDEAFRDDLLSANDGAAAYRVVADAIGKRG